MIKIRYYANVKKACGWRQEKVIATAEKISDKTCIIIEAKFEDVNRSERQKFDLKFWSDNEIGKRKRISSVTVLSEVESMF